MAEKVAAFHDAAPRPCSLLITHGLSGADKSTVARAVAEAPGAVCLRPDVERKRLHGLSPLARSESGIAGGLYAEAATRATYERLAELAALALAAGCSVVIDAACLRRWQRNRFHDLARELGVPLLILDCRAPRDVLQQRLATRAELGGDASEATPAVLARQFHDAEPLSAEERDAAVVVDCADSPVGRSLERIRQRVSLAP